MNTYLVLRDGITRFLNDYQDYANFVNGFLNSFGTMSIEQMLEFNDYNVESLDHMRIYFILILYSCNQQKAIQSSSLTQKLFKSLETYPNQSLSLPSLSLLFQQGMLTEIKNIDNLQQIEDYAAIFQICKSKGLDLPLISQQLSQTLSSLLLSLSSTLTSLQDESFAIKIPNHLKSIHTSGIDFASSFSNLIESAFSSIHLLLTSPDIPTKTLEILSKFLKSCKNLDFFPQNLIERSDQVLQVLHINIKVSDPYQENLSVFIKPEALTPQTLPANLEYVGTQNLPDLNSNYKTDFYYYKFQNSQYISRFIYTYRNLDRSRLILNHMFDVNEYLASISDDFNCFVKIFYCTRLEAQSEVYTELYNDTLYAKLLALKQGNMLDEGYVKLFSRTLAKSFAQMEECNIYHQNVNPLNILLTPAWRLKIVNFQLSYVQELSAEVLQENRDLRVLDMDRFRAPEVEKCVRTGEWIRINRAKSDVFSFGLVLLFIYLHELDDGLNREENYGLLLTKIETIRFDWLKQILQKILVLDPTARPNFSTIYSLMPN